MSRIGRGRRRRARAVRAALAAAALGAAALVASGGERGTAAGGRQWFKADLHVHSVLSADSFPDIGVIASNAKAAGYNAIFLTDHNDGSAFAISQLTANRFWFRDALRRWDPQTAGSPSSSAVELVTSPVKEGTHALRLAAASPGAGEAAVSTRRGPTLRAGARVRFSVFPKRLDAGGGLYVSASLGGDETVAEPIGYTTAAGVVSPGRHTVFVWYLGAPPPASFNPKGSVIATNLAGGGFCDRPLATNVWITCTIRLDDALSRMPAADRPRDDNAWTQLKMAAVASDGTVEGVFDDYLVEAVDPEPTGEEFTARNARIPAYDSASFRLLPAAEMGIRRHAHRLHFGIDKPSQYVRFNAGVDGIIPAQQAGYPAQLNHPGVDGGVTDEEAIANDAFGADLLEVRHENMVHDWDAILKKGVPVVGGWGTDNHVARFSSSSQATLIHAPALTHDALLRSLFEGRAALAAGGPRLVLNLDPASQDPHPARYPVFVSDAAASIPVHAAAAGSIPGNGTIRWIANGATLATSSSPDETRAVPLPGATAYVRAEIRNAAGGLSAMTQPIVFRDVAGLPAGMRAGVVGIDTPDGRDYTRLRTKGATAAAWSASAKRLTLTLENPAGSLVHIQAHTAGQTPSGVAVDGAAVARASSRAGFDAATGPSWWHDAASGFLLVKARQGSGTTTLAISFGEAGPGPGARAFTPAADAYTSADAPSANFGGATTLRVDGSPVVRSWLRFTVSGLDGAVTRATLRVRALSEHSKGYEAFRVASASWGEGTITHANAPAVGARLGASGPATAGGWTSIDVTPYVTGNGAYAFALQGTSATALSLSSRESADEPQLVIETGGGDAPTDPPPAGGTAVTVTPAADAYTSAEAPSSNFGSAATLRADGSPLIRSFLRFTVPALPGPVARATLRIRALSAHSAGFQVHAVAGDDWQEGAISHASAPALGAVIGSSGPLSAGQWVEVDVTPYVAGNGTYSLALTTTSATALSLSSRESADEPQLVIETGGGDAPTDPPPAGGTAVTVTPAADAYTSAEAPSSNFGSAATLRADGSPLIRSFLRFTLSGLPGPATRATLRIRAASNHSSGFQVHGVASNSWQEGAITHASAPALGAVIGASGAFSAGQWVEVDVTPYLTGNGSYSLALATTSNTAMSLSSRESATPPQLVVEG